MVEELDRPYESARIRYEITVAGRPGWVLEGAAAGWEIAERGSGRIRLTGTIADQAALVGLLARLQDLRFEVLEVHQVS